MPRPKKVGALPKEGDEEFKRTNEIKTAAPLLEAIDIEGKVITADALLTQRKFAEYLREYQAHYHFTVKANQPRLLADITLYFNGRGKPDYIEDSPPEHGRIETRKIWIPAELSGYLDFPHVGQAFVIERHCEEIKSGKRSCETCYG